MTASFNDDDDDVDEGAADEEEDDVVDGTVDDDDDGVDPVGGVETFCSTGARVGSSATWRARFEAAPRTGPGPALAWKVD